MGPSETLYDVAVIGGGIVGLATARALAASGRRVVVVEAETALAQHQTARNSGVVHAGLYYPPGSLKARLCTSGRARMADYCRERDLPYDECGKLVVAVDDGELDGLREIHRRAEANGVPDVRWLDARELRDVEPAARGVAAVHSPRTAITDFGAVAHSFASDVARHGGTVLLEFDVVGIEQDSDTVMLLHRPDRYEPGQHEGVVEVIIGKQRNGPTGEITLAYIKQYMRFENFAVGTPFES